MIEVIIGQIWPYLLGLLALAAGWLTAKRAGRQEGRREVRQEQLEAEQADWENARAIENETASMSDSAIADELKRDWVRGPRW
ncbi:hypothetical protein ACFWQD_06240 [Alcaligenes faecalis]|uniref:hypothetical protein n=1 Tax=Alcaligenes faecalis TaxID=511 RepID=UPI0036654191